MKHDAEQLDRINAVATGIVHSLLELEEPAEIMGTLELVVLSLILTAAKDHEGAIDFFHQRLHAGLVKAKADAH